MNGYRLVDCDFYDRLEAWATLRQICKIIYLNQSQQTLEVNSQIIDVYAEGKADYLKLSDGTTIRLDRILSVNDLPILFAN